MSAPFDKLNFDNTFSRQLPADPILTNQVRQVRGACFSRVRPTVVTSPKLAAYSREVLADVGLSEEDVKHASFAEILGGNHQVAGMDTYAACYGGHQFGHWAGQLGDGRAISLGAILNQENQRWELQLKGAGPTPYSRSADGRAVMRSSVREFLCSEAMFHLGVPTTRALSLVDTGQSVVRDMFYDGNPAPERGAIVCRVAPSFLRFGNFEMASAQGDTHMLTCLLDYALEHHFPQAGPPSRDAYLALFETVCQTTAELMVHWMRVGFVHGVMNTDNMSLLGLTMDYGPYGWLEDYDPDWTPNTTDRRQRRYRYSAQPRVAVWNLMQLANALYPLIEDAEPLQEALGRYGATFERRQKEMMAEKLGLERHSGAEDEHLIDSLLEALVENETDMTLFYRRLANVSKADAQRASDQQLLDYVADAYYTDAPKPVVTHEKMALWLQRYVRRIQEDSRPDLIRRQRMNEVNPKYVMRNYLAQVAIDKADQGDFSEIMTLLDVMRTPYAEQPNRAQYAKKRPAWARHRPGCSMLSCSS
jgi:uncharacterized protein YdiU (UPF0061 family)